MDGRRVVSATTKLQRAAAFANAHISIMSEFLQSAPFKTSSDGRRGPGTVPIAVVLDKPIPPDAMANLGDAIHNYRSVLDHIVFELCMRANNRASESEQRGFYLPASNEDGEAYKKKLRRSFGFLPKPSFDILLRCNMFPNAPDSTLYNLHCLDNLDKHRAIRFIQTQVTVTDLELVSPIFPNGETVQSLPPLVVKMMAATDRILGTHTGSYYGVRPLLDIGRRPLMQYTKFNSDNMSFEFQFASTDPFGDESIADVLGRVGRIVSSVLEQAKWLFAFPYTFAP